MAATPSGKDKLAKWLRLFVGGYDLSGDARTVGGFSAVPGEVDMTAWSDEVYNFLQNGRKETMISAFQAFVNDDTAGAFTLLKTAGTLSDVIACFGGGGEPAVPDPCFLMPSVQFSNTATFDAEAAVITTDFKVDASATLNGYANPWGWTLANALFTATSSNASHDNGAASANGGAAVIQVLDATGDMVFTIEDSADDAAWATIGTFTLDGTAIGSEFITFTGAVRQYVRFTATRTSGTNNIVCGYVRN